jgi:hypothetical protein
MQAARAAKFKDNVIFYETRRCINIECAFGILAEKFDALNRPQSATLKHQTNMVSVRIKLHNWELTMMFTWCCLSGVICSCMNLDCMSNEM